MTNSQNSGRVGEQSADEVAAKTQHDHEDEIVDEWGDESFPASDPPAGH